MTAIRQFLRALVRAGIRLLTLIPAVLGALGAAVFAVWIMGEISEALPDLKKGAIYGTAASAAIFLHRQILSFFSLLKNWLGFLTQKAEQTLAETLRKTVSFSHGILEKTFSTAFPIALLLVVHAMEDPPEEAAEHIEFVHVFPLGAEAVQQTANDPYIVPFPHLIFKPGALVDRTIETITAPDDVRDPNTFNPESMELSEGQLHNLREYVRDLPDACSATADNPVTIEVIGLSNDLHFLGAAGEVRTDSDHLNTALANFRGQSVQREIDRMIADLELKNIVLTDLKNWTSFEQMQEERDTSIFAEVSFTLSPVSDFRSTVLKLHSCRFSVRKPTEQEQT